MKITTRFWRWAADCIAVFITGQWAITYFNFGEHKFYHPGFGGIYGATLSASFFIISMTDLILTFNRRPGRYKKKIYKF